MAVFLEDDADVRDGKESSLGRSSLGRGAQLTWL
jgi:hypothetical protein